MYRKIAITLPENLVCKVEKERKEVNLTRSAFFRKAIEVFLGVNLSVDEKLVKKYRPIYAALQKEDKKISEEMMDIASDTIPNK